MVQPSLEIIIGPMYSGKTTELLRRLFNAAEVGMKVLYINHSIDNRNTDVYSTHNPQLKNKLSDLVQMIQSNDLTTVDIKPYDIIGIDEAHFFQDLKPVIDWIDNNDKLIIVSGLDADAHKNTFGHIYELIPHCDTIVKLKSYCTVCASTGVLTNAIFSKKIIDDSQIIDVGAHDKYTATCRRHFNPTD